MSAIATRLPQSSRSIFAPSRNSGADGRVSKSVIRKDEQTSEVGKRGKGRECPVVGPISPAAEQFRALSNVDEREN